MRAGEMRERSEEESRRIVTGEHPINAGRDRVAMGVDSVGGEKQKMGHSVYGQSDKRHVIYRQKGEQTGECLSDCVDFKHCTAVASLLCGQLLRATSLALGCVYLR